jgi:hypothetical protein
MRKKVIGILIVITGLLGTGFAGRTAYAEEKYKVSDSWNRNKYEEVYSGYSSKIELLYKRLDEKNDALENERRKKNYDTKKVERLLNERRIIKNELDNTYKDLRYELRRNNIRDYSYRS